MQPREPHKTNPANEVAQSADALSSNAPGVPTYRYADLSQSSNEVLIEHDGQMYRLRMTRNGKLILNK